VNVDNEDIAAIHELHELDRKAHLEGNADLLAGGMAEHIWEASRGQLNRIARSDVRDRFAAYFASVRYSVWDDLVQPHVAVSHDGTFAWMAVHIEARLAAVDDPQTEREFESSWIAMYEKVDGRWLMAGISSSVVDRTE
jgi:hypothetical protein